MVNAYTKQYIIIIIYIDLISVLDCEIVIKINIKNSIFRIINL